MSTTTASRAHALDPRRIAASTGAIALNAVGLMLLLVPMAVPPIIEHVQSEPVVIIERRPPPLPVTPVPVEVRQPTTRPRPEPRVQQPVAQPPTATTDDPQPGDAVVPPGDVQSEAVMAEVVAPPDDGRPMEGAHLEYASAPAPTYPRGALRAGLTGTVMLEVLVDVDGRPLEVRVVRSSGHRVLDAAAKRQVLGRWTFRPAIRDGRPVQAIGIIPVEFKLD